MLKDGRYDSTLPILAASPSHEQLISLTHLLDNIKNESQKLKR